MKNSGSEGISSIAGPAGSTREGAFSCAKVGPCCAGEDELEACGSPAAGIPLNTGTTARTRTAKAGKTKRDLDRNNINMQSSASLVSVQKWWQSGLRRVLVQKSHRVAAQKSHNFSR